MSKAISSGAETYFLVLSDETGQRASRRTEATRAAQILGVPQRRSRAARRIAAGGPEICPAESVKLFRKKDSNRI